MDGSPLLRSRAWVAPLCWTAVLLDGFDAVVLGAVLPSTLENGELGMTTAQGTAVATVVLPESPSWLTSQGRAAEARAVGEHYGVHVEHHTPGEEQEERSGGLMPLSAGWRRNSIAVWIASFMGLLLVHGLNTWLPQIMRAADYDLGNSLGFLLVLNVGAIAGLAVAGRVADRITPRVAGIVWFLGSAVLLAALAVKLPLLGIYVMVLLTGCFVFSSQVLVYAFTAASHPPRVRATALGTSAGVGRLGAISGPIVGGTLLSAGLAYPWGFFAFAAVGALGGADMTGTRTRHELREPGR